VVQETRLFDPDRGETRPMRSKEDAHDYRYFPDPDLLPLQIGPRWIDEVRRSMPALPATLRSRFEQMGVSPYDAWLLTESREKAEFFERSAAEAKVAAPVSLAHWTNGEVSALANATAAGFEALPIDAASLARLHDRIQDGTISAKAAKEVLHAMAAGEGEPDAIIEKRGLRQLSDAGALGTAIDGVLAANARLVADYRAGKEKAFNALVGQVMKATGGKANPQEASRLLKERLGHSREGGNPNGIA
jgi:aspartyl-tRNA(Asn)/glutamyl-tRNA(Gln) amidotransferase subunit B